MTQAKSGDTVQVHYTGTLEDGSQFDSSVGSDPLQFTIGTSQVIPGFENGVTGMVVGDKKTVTLPSDEAYGPVREDLVQKVEKSELPEDIDLKMGLVLQSQQPDGIVVNLVVTELDDTSVTLDANPPLAGKTLIFDIELVSINQ